MKQIDLETAQGWERDTDSPCLTLGGSGAFDDTHMFAPCVAMEDGMYSMWYCGSRGAVEDRVFRLGLAISTDGVSFTRHPASPVCKAPDETSSILTPTLLRNPDGSLLREGGRLRMWFTCADLTRQGPSHTLRQMHSPDGVSWSEPSASQLDHAYAPTIIKEDDDYRLWYTDVSCEPWCMRHAMSKDGCEWDLVSDPVLCVDQDWEHERLFYPTVLKQGELYLMWYGSYSLHRPEELKTSLGFAVSRDGVEWTKHPQNPVFGPDGNREWESNYTTSQTILPRPDGSWRIWYASRGKRIFDNKYLAIGTAKWELA